jgi:hypothetical protein
VPPPFVQSYPAVPATSPCHHPYKQHQPSPLHTSSASPTNSDVYHTRWSRAAQATPAPGTPITANSSHSSLTAGSKPSQAPPRPSARLPRSKAPSVSRRQMRVPLSLRETCRSRADASQAHDHAGTPASRTPGLRLHGPTRAPTGRMRASISHSYT